MLIVHRLLDSQCLVAANMLLFVCVCVCAGAAAVTNRVAVAVLVKGPAEVVCVLVAAC